MLFDNLERFPPVPVFATKLSWRNHVFRSTAYFASASHSSKIVSAIGVILFQENCVFSLLRVVLLAKPYCNPSAIRVKDPLFQRWSLVVLFSCRGRITTAHNPGHRLPVRRSKALRIHLLFFWPQKNATSGQSQFLSSFPPSLVGPTIPRLDAASYR